MKRKVKFAFFVFAILAASLVGWVTFLQIKLASFGPIRRNEVPGVYMANYPGAEERLILKPDGTYELQYLENGKRNLADGSWKFLLDHGDPEISFSGLFSGRNPFPESAADYASHGVWPRQDPEATYSMALLRNKLSGALYIELHPDTNDYYEKQDN